MLGSTGTQMVPKDGREATTRGERGAVLVETVSVLVRRKSARVEALQLVSAPAVVSQEKREILPPRPLLRSVRRGASTHPDRV